MTTTPDDVLLSAVDLARSAVLEIAPSADRVGDHEGSVADGELVVTHYFTCLDRGYRGWRWAATVSRTPDSSDVTVAEVVLLPGSDALLAPAWVPWDQRVRPGDLGPGDLHPTPLDDPRLEPGFSGADALEAVDETATDVGVLRPEQWELGLGRETVLSPYGRGIAADRWYDGEFGPDSPMAKAAPAHCASCGFLLPIGGQLGQVFGACANPLGADGRIVALGYGCGAHSSVKPLDGTGVPVTGIAVDDGEVEVVDLAAVPAPRPAVDDDELELVGAPGAEATADVVAPDAALVEAVEGAGSEATADDPASTDAAADADGEQLAIVVDEIVEVDVIGVEVIEGEVLELHLDDDAEDDDDLEDDDEDDEDDEDDDLEDDDEDDEDEDEDDEDEDEDDDALDEVVSELDDVVDIEPDEVL